MGVDSLIPLDSKIPPSCVMGGRTPVQFILGRNVLNAVAALTSILANWLSC